MSATEGCAFVTFLMMNDTFLPGALLQGFELNKQASRFDRVCLVTEEVSREARSALRRLYKHVVPIEKIYVPHRRRQGRQDRPYLLTRLQALRLGPDGDLGLRYRKIVLLDADVLPLKRFDQLFLLPTPAGIPNESKAHFVTDDGRGRFVRPRDVEINGRWIWHEIYHHICHGERIPRHVTDRVAADPKNLGINAALLVLEPSLSEYQEIMRDIERPSIRRLLGEAFDWPDMQYLTMRWSGRWVNIDLSFNGLCGYPSLSVLCGTHYAGLKPWDHKRADAFGHHRRYPDFRYWHRRFLEMMSEYPGFRGVRRLVRLSDAIGPGRQSTPRKSANTDTGSATSSQ